jgi:hypothetical protein
MNTIFSNILQLIKDEKLDPKDALYQLQNGGNARQLLNQAFTKLYPTMNATVRDMNVQNYLATNGIQDFKNALQGLGTWTAPSGATYTYNNDLVRTSPRIYSSDTSIQGTTGQTMYQGPSIVDYLNSIGEPSDFNSRRKISQMIGVSNYTGTPEQNTQILNIIRNPQGENQYGGIGIQQYSPNKLDLSRLIPTSNGFVNQQTGEIHSEKDVARSIGNQIGTMSYNSGYRIDPEVLKLTDWRDFLDQANQTIDPYYQEQYKQIRDITSRKISQIEQDLGLKTGELQRTSERNVRTGRETLADRGLTFSGQRQTFEQQSKDELQRSLDLANTEAQRSAQDILRQAEGQSGTSNLQGYVPNTVGGRALLFGNITGALPYERESQIFNRAQALSSSENARRQYAWNLQKFNS